MGAHRAIEVAKTVLEVADAAFVAAECAHHHLPHHHNQNHKEEKESADKVNVEVVSRRGELEDLRSENRRLRSLLEQNLKLLQNLSEPPPSLPDCPSDLHARLVSKVNSEDFLARLESLSQATVEGTCNQFPFKEATGEDVQTAEVLIHVDQKEPSWWVWVTDDMVPSNIEERSEIDGENYVVITEEHVVEGVAYFMAKCMLSNPKTQNVKPEELQKALAKALGGMSKLERMIEIWDAGRIFYTLSTWGLALAGLYKTRAALKFAAIGVHATSKVIAKAL